MDLRSILTEDRDSQPAHNPATPVTPAQQHKPNSVFGTPQDFPTGATSGRQLSHTSQQYHQSAGSFSGGLQIQAPYVSPVQYQGHPQQPPPLQVPSNQDLRSPAPGSYSGNSAQSPYSRQTPTSAQRSSYPFPPTYHAPQSPAQQHHQYPPTFNPYPVPQTPPVGIPGSTHPYLQTQHQNQHQNQNQHQRSQSSVSIGTPTSTHSQPPYFNQPATPNAPPSERHSGSERERSLSVSPKSQPTKRKMDQRVESPSHMDARKAPKTKANGMTMAPRPKHYPTPPIWAQSIKNKRIAVPAIANSVKAVQSHVPPPAPTIPESQTNGHIPVSTDAFLPFILGGKRAQQQMTKYVADWLFLNVVNRDDYGDLTRHGVEIEIEAKLGQVNELDSDMRLQIAAATECALRDGKRVGFKSAMPILQHKNLNAFLNGQVQATHPQNPQRGNRPEVKHSHIKQVDRSYDLPTASYRMLPPSLLQYARNAKLRISTDKATGRVVATIIKGRMADLHICNPFSSLDCRISVSFEMKVDGDSEEVVQIVAGKSDMQRADRDKDRHSYTQPHYQFDHTVVKKILNGVPVQDLDGPSLEVEIEVSTTSIREHGGKALKGLPHQYPELVEGLLDNYRVLAREADRPPSGP